MASEKFTNHARSTQLLKELGDEFALIQNPGYIYPPFELAPLAPKITGPVDHLVGVVMDMDGTTTTTEALCLHSLETMVRRITGRVTPEMWVGLDKQIDYPHIIGNSTTKHVEYLVKTYGSDIQREAFARALLEAALWTLADGADPQRRQEVRATLTALGWSHLLHDSQTESIVRQPKFDPAESASAIDALLTRYENALNLASFSNRVRAAVDIYYYRYHQILAGIAAGAGKQFSAELPDGQRLIEPMPGVAFFLALVRGWLGENAGRLHDTLIAQSDFSGQPDDVTRLANLGRYFEAHPLKLALVTSSIRYEADIVLNEVFSVLREEISGWPVCRELADRFANPAQFYDAYLTASDSSEIRLKPHRDLYSLALHALGIPPEDFGAVIGFEDSESGTIALRAAGVGLCVAVPFADTHGHDFSAAAWVLPGGLPQAILAQNLFLKLRD